MHLIIHYQCVRSGRDNIFGEVLRSVNRCTSHYTWVHATCVGKAKQGGLLDFADCGHFKREPDPNLVMDKLCASYSGIIDEHSLQ